MLGEFWETKEMLKEAGVTRNEFNYILAAKPGRMVPVARFGRSMAWLESQIGILKKLNAEVLASGRGRPRKTASAKKA